MRINPDYRDFLPRNPAQFEQLRANILRDGIISDPLRFDARTGELLDGHQRSEVAEATGISFAHPPVAVHGLNNRADALHWIVQNDHGRRNLNAPQRFVVLETLRAELVSRGRENCRAGGRKKGLQKSGKVRADRELAHELGVSHDTVHRLNYVRSRGCAQDWRQLEADPHRLNHTYLDLRARVRDREQKKQVQEAIAALPVAPEVSDGKGTWFNRIHCCDVLDGLLNVPDRGVDLTFTSPPYPLPSESVAYDRPLSFNSYQEWLDWSVAWLTELHRVTADGGRLAVELDELNNGWTHPPAVLPVPFDFTRIATAAGFTFRGSIVWEKGKASGAHPLHGCWQHPRVQRTASTILCFGKGSTRMEREARLRDTTDAEFHYSAMGTWRIPPETRRLCGHPAPFPAALAHRLIKWLAPYRGTTILDPFSGTGTVPFVAARSGRRWVGIDNSAKYCRFARDRVANSAEVLPPVDFDRKSPAVSRRRRASAGHRGS